MRFATPRRALGIRQMPAGSRIDRPVDTVRRRHARGDLARDSRTGAEAGVDEAPRLQRLERGGIGIAPVRLEQHVAVPAQPQPGEVGEDRLDMLGAAARAVDIRSEEHTSELQSLMRISYAVFCLKK